MPSSEEGLSGGDVVTVKHELKNGKSVFGRRLMFVFSLFRGSF